MNTLTLGKILAGAGAVLLALGLIVWGVDTYHKSHATKDEAQAQVFKGEANATQTQAQASDKAFKDLQAEHAQTKADLAGLLIERSKLLAKLATQKQNSGTPRPSDSGTIPVAAPPLPDDLASRDAVIAKDAEVITAQTKVIQDQQTEIITLTDARDQWKSTADLRLKQATAQEAATAAWKDAVATAQWKGGLKGLAVGVIVGYLGAKR